MPNFTIQRVIESGYTVGCTNFQTNQYEGDTASLVSGSPLDGSIVWELNADTGWTVDIADFGIPGTIPTAYPQTATVRTFQNDPGVPPSIAPVKVLIPATVKLEVISRAVAAIPAMAISLQFNVPSILVFPFT